MTERGPSSGPGCAEVEVLAAELALNMVSGADRAVALAHLGECLTCRRLVDELAGVADNLLLLAPEHDPSIGFETRILAATGAGGSAGAPAAAPPTAGRLEGADTGRRGRSRRLRRSPLRLVAAAAVLLLAILGGLVTGLAVDEAEPPLRTALAVTAGGRSTCRALAYGDEQAWVFVSLETPREWTADYIVEVTTLGGGTPAAVGRLRLQGGHGAMGATVDVPAERLRAIRVLDTNGALRYEAAFKAV